MFGNFSYTPSQPSYTPSTQSNFSNSVSEPRSSSYNSSFELPEVAPSLLSSLAFFSPTKTISASFWSGEVRFWRLTSSNSATPVTSIRMPEAVLSSCFSSSAFYSSSADGSISAFDMNANSSSPLNREEAPVSSLACLPNENVLISGSWGGTVSLYDLRQARPFQNLRVSGRVNGLAVSENKTLVLGTNEGELFSLKIGTTDSLSKVSLSSSTSYYSSITTSTSGSSNLTGSINSLDVSADGKTACVGMSNGKVALVSLEGKGKEAEISCHSKDSYYGKNEMFSSNSVVRHPYNGIFCSSGGDGKTHFINAVSKKVPFSVEAPSVKSGNSYYSSSKVNLPAVASCFGENGKILVRGYCYDWSKGHKGNSEEGSKSKIFVNYSNL